MRHEKVTARFRSELHARWSVFFDYLEVPYAYEPETFRAADGTQAVPAFWLPRQRTWFVPETRRPPVWWDRFAAAATEADEPSSGDERAADPAPFEMSEEWRGEVLLCVGAIPDGYAPADGLAAGPWHAHDQGMLTHDDACYRWTICPTCGTFGAAYFGFAERLPCRCLEQEGRGKVDNSGDERLRAAYRAAAEEPVATEPITGYLRWPAVREALVRQQGAALAQQQCIRQCISVGEQLRAELPAGAYPEVPDGADALCGACPGFVCTECGTRPAAAAGIPCRICEPQVMLTKRRARAVLNAKAAEAGKASGRPARDINALLNRAVRRRSRDFYSLEELGQALTLVEQWIADPSLIPPTTAPARRPSHPFEPPSTEGLPSTASPDSTHTTSSRRPDRVAFEAVTFDVAGVDFPPPTEIEALPTAVLRTWLGTGVGTVSELVGVSVEKLEDRLTKTVGCKQLETADEADLRESLRVLRAWLNDPATCRPPARKPRMERPEGIGQLPVPRTTKLAHTDLTCGLCCDPIKAGELTGRFRPPKDLRTYTAMGWLCAHCLYQRRQHPRRRDLLLRIFHQLFAGNGVDFNAYECELLHTWLTETPAPATTTAWNTDPLETTLARLQNSAAEDKASTWIATPTAGTIIAALNDAVLTPQEKVLLDAVARHLYEWQANPNGVQTSRYGTGVRYRSQILRSTAHPTLLSVRGGPFDLHQAPQPRPADQDDPADPSSRDQSSL